MNKETSVSSPKMRFNMALGERDLNVLGQEPAQLIRRQGAILRGSRLGAVQHGALDGFFGDRSTDMHIEVE